MKPEPVPEPASTPEAARLADAIVREGIACGARSIHLSADPGGRLIVRHRGPAGLVPAPVPCHAPDVRQDVVDAFKRRAQLQVAERRVPQDGAFVHEGRPLRVATLPTTQGEAVVLELLEVAVTHGLATLGLDPAARARLVAALDAPGGLLLAVGPQGGGKRTLLHACLRHLAQDTTRTTYSVPEDVPPDLPGIVTCRIDPIVADVPMRSWLACVLNRFDPDVLHAPRLHDLDTSELLLDAAARGRTVLATMFADDGASAMRRLLDLGHPAYHVAAGLSLVVGCRALRRLCEACKRPAPAPDPADRRRLAPRLEDEELLGEWEESFVPRRGGCPACGGAGTTGRVGVYEVVDRAGARLEAGLRAGGDAVREHAYARVRSLREAALLLAAAGQVSLVDALRSTPVAPSGSPVHA